MAASNQISPSGSYNHAGVDYISPKTTGTNISVLTSATGTMFAEFDVTNQLFASKKVNLTVAPTAQTHAARVQDTVNNTFAYGGTTAGAANTYTVSLSPALTAYAAGQEIEVIFNATNTGASTLNVNSLGAKAITYLDTTALVGNELYAGIPYKLFYDGTRFRIISFANTVPTDYVPTYGASGSMGFNTVTTTTAKWHYQGGRIFFELVFSGTTVSTAAANITATLPVVSPNRNIYLPCSIVDTSIQAAGAIAVGGTINFGHADGSVWGIGSGRACRISNSYPLV
jgi:hypothetical protein